MTDDAELAAELLAQAREIAAAPANRAEGVERRATTLLGTVAIAASLTVTGAGLVLDPQKLHGTVWRLLVAIGLLLATGSFVMCGWRAVLALSRVHVWTSPEGLDILRRRSMGLARARVDLATFLLHSAGANDPIAEWKVAYLGAAAWWFVRALGCLIATAFVLVLYVAMGPSAAGASKQTPINAKPTLTVKGGKQQKPNARRAKPASTVNE